MKNPPNLGDFELAIHFAKFYECDAERILGSLALSLIPVDSVACIIGSVLQEISGTLARLLGAVNQILTRGLQSILSVIQGFLSSIVDVTTGTASIQLKLVGGVL